MRKWTRVPEDYEEIYQHMLSEMQQPDFVATMGLLTAWGHPMTSGLPTIDAFLSADAMEPPDAQDHYSEELVRLPGLVGRPDSGFTPA